MADEQATALYDKAIELARGEDTYVPGVDKLVPIHQEALLMVWSADTGGEGTWKQVGTCQEH